MNKSHILVATFIFVGAVFLTASYFAEERERDIVADIKLGILEQEKTLSNIAEVTARNGADEVTESIVVDCSLDDRTRFDELLSSLASLNATQLDETDNLFDKCANFFAQRKALMVARMTREYEAYENLVNLLSIIDDEIAVAEYNVSGWLQLVELEKRRSAIFDRQVVLQQQIISALQEGESPTSENMSSMMREANSIKEEAAVINTQSSDLRSSLLAL